MLSRISCKLGLVLKSVGHWGSVQKLKNAAFRVGLHHILFQHWHRVVDIPDSRIAGCVISIGIVVYP